MARQLTAVIAGCGGISRAWLNGVRDIPDLQMVGFVDLNEGAAHVLSEEYGWQSAAVGTDLSSILERVSPDVVFDCTIPEAHVQVTLEALQHGCHVLGEKPLADSMANARKMVAAAEEAGRIFAVIQNRRYDPNIRRLRRFLASGAIGPITTVNCDFYIGAHFGGFRDRMEHVLLLDMAIHTFDAARLISGADPVSVFCKEWNPAGSWYDHDASAVAVFEMTGGIVYTYRGSWCAEGLNTTWESDWRIIGTKGSVIWDGAAGFQAQAVARPAASSQSGRPGAATAGHAREDRWACRSDPRVRATACRTALPPKPSARTTSRAWPWSSAPSRAPKQAIRSPLPEPEETHT